VFWLPLPGWPVQPSLIPNTCLSKVSFTWVLHLPSVCIAIPFTIALRSPHRLLGTPLNRHHVVCILSHLISPHCQLMLGLAGSTLPPVQETSMGKYLR